MTSPGVQLTLGPRVGGDPHPALAGFHPAVAEWFRRRFPEGPTTPQTEGWPHIAAGHDTLIAAPTGSGKTLSGFLVCIDRLYRAHEQGDDVTGSTRVVYVSPLKALAVDIAENLERPLAEIAASRRGAGARRTQAARRGAHRRLHQLRARPRCCAGRRASSSPPPSRSTCWSRARRDATSSAPSRPSSSTRSTRSARDKRGAHLAVTLERLEAIARAAATTRRAVGHAASGRDRGAPARRHAPDPADRRRRSPAQPRPRARAARGRARSRHVGRADGRRASTASPTSSASTTPRSCS